MLTRIISLCIFLLAINIAYGNKIGLDSGHSIKELYKSGGVSTVQVVNAQGIPEPKPYFSIGWPAGGVKWDYISSMSKKNAYKYYVMITNSVDFPDWRHYFSLDPFSLSEKTGSDSEKRFYFQDIRFFKVRVSSPLPSPSSCIANFAQRGREDFLWVIFLFFLPFHFAVGFYLLYNPVLFQFLLLALTKGTRMCPLRVNC